MSSLVTAICLGAIYNVLDFASDPVRFKPFPKFSFEDRAKTRLDLASLDNCQWSQPDLELTPIDLGRPFAFGFQTENNYHVVTVDPTASNLVQGNDGCRVFQNGDLVCSYKANVTKHAKTPTSARFLR
jgi:hypothetical protein